MTAVDFSEGGLRVRVRVRVKGTVVRV